MEWQEVAWLIAGIAIGLCVLILLVSLICFLKVFYSPTRKVLAEDEYEYPPGHIYKPYHAQMLAWMKDLRTRPHEKVSVKSYDGLTLQGTYYEYSPDAPVELLFHGYQGNAERDLSAAVERCFKLGRSTILIDQRAGGKSDGHIITFGAKECKDCLTWIQFATEKFGKDKKLMIGGVSMGAATVLLASAYDLPDNVVCVMADCGYSSAKEIIKKVVTEMRLPANVVYPFIKLGALIYGGFNLDKATPKEAVKHSKKPIILLHGDDDAFVPYEMSEEIYEACPNQRKLVRIVGAGHGLAYPKDPDTYVNALREFSEECGF